MDAAFCLLAWLLGYCHQTKQNTTVMGGKSTGTFAVDPDQKAGIFHGSVEIVSFLNAPGFIKAETTVEKEGWPDVSTCRGLQLVVKSSTPNYRGFRVSFGHKRPPGAFPYSYGFKTDMVLRDTANDDTNGDKFQQIDLPFDAFTDKWDAGTGDAIVTCHDNKEYCPDEATLKDLYSIGVWGEGVEGNVDLRIRSISAYGCNSDTSDSGIDTSGIESNAIAIEDFSDPINEWTTMNDPVMGGKSYSSLDIHDGMATFDGKCAIVPFLHAPGFITMTTGLHPKPTSRTNKASTFPDVSSCEALAVTVRSNLPDEYGGYYLSFGTDRVPGGHHAMGYKTHLTVPTASNGDDDDDDDSFHDLVLPFSGFSSHWDEATGKTTVTCLEDSSVCPTAETLRDMKTISIWAEGVEGIISLSVRYVGAVGCKSSNSNTNGSGNGASGGEATGMVLGERSSSSSSSSSGRAESSAPCLMGMATIVVLGLLLARHGTRRGSKKSSDYVEVKQQVVVEAEAVPIVAADSDLV